MSSFKNNDSNTQNILDITKKIIANNSPITLEELANNLNIYSHEGSYDYMLLSIIINDLHNHNYIDISYTQTDILINNKHII